ncbi:mechanosensitive ion channel family protein [Cellulomonas soli]|uniref:mechanosensitive ion channel family protein n=1 Tax=Cellulomonas soli TaxID=931535 RepID=UPI003F88024F
MLSSPVALAPLPLAVTPEPAGGAASGMPGLVVAAVVAVVVAWLASLAVAWLVRRLTRRSVLGADLGARTHAAVRALLVALALHVALTRGADPATWLTVVDRVLVVAAIAGGAWVLAAAALGVAQASAEREMAADLGDPARAAGQPDPRSVARGQAQVHLVRVLVVPVLAVVAVGLALLTLPGTAPVGLAFLAVAALLGVATVVAARDLLADLVAGARLAFDDVVRLDDVVVVEGQWGRVEQISLTRVVVQLWDDRRLVLPTSAVTSMVVESWTRTADGPLGAVELDLDWTVPVDALRSELERLLTQDELWDGRVGVLQVVDAVGGSVRVRALLSAQDAPALDDLRCAVREGLLGWLQQQGRDVLPRTRQEQVGPAQVRPAPAPRVARAISGETQAFDVADQRARQFAGSLEGLGRARAFAGPGQGAVAARSRVPDAPAARVVVTSGRTARPAAPAAPAAPVVAAVSAPAPAPRRSATSSPVGSPAGGVPRSAPAPVAAQASPPVIVYGRGPVAEPPAGPDPRMGATQVFGGPTGPVTPSAGYPGGGYLDEPGDPTAYLSTDPAPFATGAPADATASGGPRVERRSTRRERRP